jgi:hypothetical protein
MKLSEFTRRARASRLEKKAKFDAAFERAKRDLQLPEAGMTPSRRTLPHTFIRSESARPILTLFPGREASATSDAGK